MPTRRWGDSVSHGGGKAREIPPDQRGVLIGAALPALDASRDLVDPLLQRHGLAASLPTHLLDALEKGIELLAHRLDARATCATIGTRRRGLVQHAAALVDFRDSAMEFRIIRAARADESLRAAARRALRRGEAALQFIDDAVEVVRFAHGRGSRSGFCIAAFQPLDGLHRGFDQFQHTAVLGLVLAHAMRRRGRAVATEPLKALVEFIAAGSFAAAAARGRRLVVLIIQVAGEHLVQPLADREARAMGGLHGLFADFGVDSPHAPRHCIRHCPTRIPLFDAAAHGR